MKTKSSRRRSSAEVTGDPRDGFPEGTVVAGRFVVQEELGRGGMGSVYRVVDRVLEQQIALKFPLRVPSESLRHKAAIRREVVLARRVTHPAVARVYDVGEHDELALLTMELVTGITLHRRLRRQHLSLEEALRLG